MKKEIDREEEIIMEKNANEAADLEIEEIEEKVDKKAAVLRKRLRAVEDEKSKCLEELQSARAEFLNSKRRIEEQLRADTKKITHKFLSDLLPLADSFDIAMEDKERWESADPTWRQGVEAIRAQLTTLFKQYKLETVGAAGEIFDPNIHEAVQTQEESGSNPDTVLSIVQKGYVCDGILIRPAKVILSI